MSRVAAGGGRGGLWGLHRPAHHARIINMDGITNKHMLSCTALAWQEAAPKAWPATAAQAVAGGFPLSADLEVAAGGQALQGAGAPLSVPREHPLAIATVG